MRNASSGESVAVVQRRHRPMYQIVLYMGLLLMLGLVVMYALGPQRAQVLNALQGTSYSNSFFFNKQLVSVLIAIGAFVFCALVPYRLFTEKYSQKIFLFGLVACILLVICGAILRLSFAQEVNGAYRWFYLGGIGSIQPSELLKFGALLFVAGFLGRRAGQGKLQSVQDTLLPLGLAIGVALFAVVVLQKDLGTGVSLTAIIMAMLVASGLSTRLLLQLCGVLLVGGVLMIIAAPHRVERIMTFIQGDAHQTAEQDDNDYHIQQARIAIGSGGLFGLGIGKSIQASGYLPEAINDSIFAIMGETFGFVGLVVILLLFTALLLSLLRVASRLGDLKLCLVAAGVFGWVASHVILNIAAMTGLAPLTGIPLPLLSYGGTSMLFIAAALGLAFQLSAYTSHKPIEEGEGNGKDFGSRRRVRRTRYASRGGF